MLYNLKEYHRPTDLDEALRLLRRENIYTVALSGGVSVVGEGTPEIEAVVDLDGLGLDFLEQEGSTIRIGAMVRLQTVVEMLSNVAGGALAETARRMAGWHVRNASTIGGTLASGDVHTPFCVMLAALNATVIIYDGEAEYSSPWEILAERVRQLGLHGELVTSIMINAPDEIGAAYEQVGRTPADIPIVSVAAVARPSGGDKIDATVAIGGLLHGLAAAKSEISSDHIDELMKQVTVFTQDESACQADYRGSVSYRCSAAMTLARRTLHQAVKDANMAE